MARKYKFNSTKDIDRELWSYMLAFFPHKFAMTGIVNDGEINLSFHRMRWKFRLLISQPTKYSYSCVFEAKPNDSSRYSDKSLFVKCANINHVEKGKVDDSTVFFLHIVRMIQAIRRHPFIYYYGAWNGAPLYNGSYVLFFLRNKRKQFNLSMLSLWNKIKIRFSSSVRINNFRKWLDKIDHMD